MKLLPALICRAFTVQLSFLVILVCVSWGSSQLYAKAERNRGKAGVSSSSQGSFLIPELLSSALEPRSAEFLQCCGAEPVWESCMPWQGREGWVHSTPAQTCRDRDIPLPKDRVSTETWGSLGSQSGLLPSQMLVLREAHESMSPVRPTASKSIPEVFPMTISVGFSIPVSFLK